MDKFNLYPKVKYKKVKELYPTLRLISTVLDKRPNPYLVKVSVYVEDTLVAEALGESLLAEEAEDRAITRALAFLEISEPEQSVAQESSEVQKVKSFCKKLKFVSEPVEETSEPVEKAPEPVEEFLYLGEDTSESVEELSETVEETSETLDVARIMQQTTEELKRIGWDAKQGKQFLLEKYSKRSRQLLTDEELVDFLTFLQGLPTLE